MGTSGVALYQQKDRGCYSGAPGFGEFCGGVGEQNFIDWFFVHPELRLLQDAFVSSDQSIGVASLSFTVLAKLDRSKAQETDPASNTSMERSHIPTAMMCSLSR
ncbi:hypothetical protein [Photobacterium sp. 1_MG-2023]|uniref:hypothetical protein n=1 Tax=Photobacterium sp. 1_MG-2023 TaxID=3062646 RepID=UPI0026E150D7|nr:hypothetical protein [Photobacterium sp. 1_MG-2023]MDO6704919.1 hypothetical protein [Photobacterium sp. 1_MG-2023]